MAPPRVLQKGDSHDNHWIAKAIGRCGLPNPGRHPAFFLQIYPFYLTDNTVLFFLLAGPGKAPDTPTAGCLKRSVSHATCPYKKSFFASFTHFQIKKRIAFA
jgi:hypothetical protein